MTNKNKLGDSSKPASFKVIGIVISIITVIIIIATACSGAVDSKLNMRDEVINTRIDGIIEIHIRIENRLERMENKIDTIIMRGSTNAD